MTPPAPAVQSEQPQLDPQVRRLGWVSFLADVSSELAYPLLPLFMTTVLGAPVAVLGLIEGIAEATASITKYPLGIATDRSGRRLPFVLAGYSLAALGKLIVGLACCWQMALAGRFVDRIGKGVRTAPRDDLLAAVTPPELRGRAFGLHRTLDTLGAVIGPLLALALVRADVPLRWIFIIAVIPGLLSPLVILAKVREQRSAPAQKPLRFSLPRSATFRWLLAGSLVFALGNSTDMFLLLRAGDVGLGAASVILVYVLYNLTYAAASLPLGRLSDRIGQLPLVIFGYVVFALVYAGFALTHNVIAVVALFAVYGLYIAATDGTSKALISRAVASEERASALGLYATLSGLATFAASFAGGLLWQYLGPWATFVFGAATALVAALVLLLTRASKTPSAEPAQPAIDTLS